MGKRLIKIMKEFLQIKTYIINRRKKVVPVK